MKLSKITEMVDGKEVPVRLYENGRWVPVDELSTEEQVARNQWQRRQRRERVAWRREQERRHRERMEKDGSMEGCSAGGS